MKNKLKTNISIVLMSILFMACQNGEDGSDGLNGFDGRDGNANVTANTYFVTPTEWNSISFGGEVNRFNASITQDVITSGLVQVYYSEDVDPSSRRWIAVPIGDLGFSYILNTITFEVYNSPNVTYNIYYKVVVIPPASKIKGVNLNDWKAVEATYNL